MVDILCLGEPLLEFNEQQPGQYVRSIGGTSPMLLSQ